MTSQHYCITPTNCYALVCSTCRKVLGFLSSDNIQSTDDWQVRCSECSKDV